MSAIYRPVRDNRNYLFRAKESVRAAAALAPDIITDRLRTVPVAPPPTLTPQAQPAPVIAAETDGGRSVLELRHPEIVKAVTLLWGFPEMNQYFDRLWLADGTHGPIDPDAMSELMILARVHQSLVPQSPGRSLASIYGSDRLHPSAERNPWRDVPPRR